MISNETSEGLILHSQKTGVSPPHLQPAPMLRTSMINSQFKFEDVVKNSSVFLKKLLKFEGQLDLDGQGHQFRIDLRHV